ANLRFFAFAVAAAMVGIAAFSLGRRDPSLPSAERGLGGRLGLFAIVLFLWGLTQETYETFRYYQGTIGIGWDRAAQMGISLVWTLGGVVLLLGGIARRYQPVRLLALGLLGLTAVKVFLFDLSSLDLPYRILSFGGLGLALI